MKKVLDDKYEVTKILLKSHLSKASHLSLTFDALTETMSEISFLGVTVHYLEGISLKSFCLAVQEFKERHKAQCIGNVLKEILLNWEIDQNKIVTVVTDNGSNVVSAVNEVFGKHRHTSCFAHKINLVATHTVGHNNLKPIISKVRNIVK